MKVSDYLIDYLSAQGIKHGFFMIGGALGHIADACARKKFLLYTTHHEQAAAFAAEGQAVISRKPGLAMATSGPGATNLITGIGSAFYASLPAVFVTGQVNTFESNITGKRRQVGFQETDIVSVVKPITKYAVRIDKAERAVYEVEKALFLAQSGRMGPVLLDFPLDIQRTEIELEKCEHFIGSKEHAALSKKAEIKPASIEKFSSMIASAKRPIILIGHGARISGAQDEIRALVDKASIPFTASLMGTDLIESSHPLYCGFIGTYALRSANFSLANADLIIVLGARLDSRQVGVQSKKFSPGAKIIHIDIDPIELGASIKEELSIQADVKEFLKAALPSVKKAGVRKEWQEHLDFLKANYGLPKQDIGADEIGANEAIAAASVVAKERAIASADVGSHQMWFAQSWSVKKGQVILTNGGMGPMGCAVPTAIGAWLSDKTRSVWAVAGDGGFQVNIHELQTIVREKVPMKMIVINNHSLGMLTQFQTENFEGRLIGSVQGYDAPDFVKVANAYGIPAKRVQKKSELAAAVKWLEAEKGAALLDIIVPTKYWVLPKSSYAKPVYDMKPFLTEDEMKKALKYVWEEYQKVK